MLTLEILRKVYKEAPVERLKLFLPHLEEALALCDAGTPARCAMFLAQIGHESAQLRYVRELASGAAYEGRLDLGNSEPGDGVRYKGRGLIQITGRDNYRQCGEYLGLPLLEKPEMLEEPRLAALSAAWFWKTQKLNSYCDSNSFAGLTRNINGGLNGIFDRITLWQRAEVALA